MNLTGFIMKGSKAAPFLALFMILLNLSTPMVNAYNATLYDFTFTQEFEPDANGHTYVYTAPDMRELYDYSRVTYSNEMNVKKYHYGTNRWWLSSFALPGVGTKEVAFQESWYAMNGWLSNWTTLPIFYEFMNSTNTYDLTAVDRITYFGMPINEEVSIIIKQDRPYYGTFNVTDEEFFYLKIISHQDDITFGISVIDPYGRMCGFATINDGDIDILPFATNGPGMYFIMIYSYGAKSQLNSLTLELQSIAPEELDSGMIVEGVLEGSEFMVNPNGGDIIHREKAPTARTFKVRSNTSMPAVVEYSVNSPELDDDIYTPFQTRVQVTSDKTFLPSGSKYFDNLNPAGGVFYYQSFQGEIYYITIVGMEETSYSFYHWTPDIPTLPIGVPIYLEENRLDTATFAFKLNLAQDSLMKVNTTDSSAFQWKIFTVQENGVYRLSNLDDDEVFSDAQPIYLPTGNYLLIGEGSTLNPPLTTFNLGPVIDGDGAVPVDVGDIVGVKVPTNYLTFYEVNVTLLNHENISSSQNIYLFNQYGNELRNVDVTLGNQQSGTAWIAFPENQTTLHTGFPTTYDMFDDGFGIIAISPYSVSNNTSGLSTLPGEHTLGFNITFEDYNDRAFNGTTTWTHGSTDWVNITLGEPGDPTEIYLLEMNAVAGTWYNVTYITEDVSSIDDISAYQVYRGFTQILQYFSLDDALVGDASKGQFQFGAVSNKVYLMITLTRTAGTEGSFDILISPFTTNKYEHPPAPHYFPSSGGGSAAAGFDPLVIGGAIGVVAVVVVVVVLVKRRRGAGA